MKVGRWVEVGCRHVLAQCVVRGAAALSGREGMSDLTRFRGGKDCILSQPDNSGHTARKCLAGTLIAIFP